MKITIFSDYVCPFCYVGKIALFRALEGHEAEIEFYPYELRRPPVEKVDPMHDEAKIKRFNEVLLPMANQLEVPMNLPWISPHPYSTLAFQGYYYAQEFNLGLAYNDAIFQAFYVDEKDIGEMSVLDEVLNQLNLDVESFHRAVEEERFMAQLNEQYAYREAREIKSVPTFFINDQRVSGFHTVEEFKKIIDQESNLELQGMSCGAEGCQF